MTKKLTYKQALAKIEKNWSKLPHDIKNGHEAVWIANSDIAGSYEVDEEWIGMKGDGTLIWAYASGCSCWSGDYDTAVEKTIKSFKLNHKWTPDEWEEKIIKFAETSVLQEFQSYSRY